MLKAFLFIVDDKILTIILNITFFEKKIPKQFLSLFLFILDTYNCVSQITSDVNPKFLFISLQ